MVYDLEMFFFSNFLGFHLYFLLPSKKISVDVASFDLRLGSVTILSYRSIVSMFCLHISVKPLHVSLCLGNNNGTQMFPHYLRDKGLLVGHHS